MTAIGVSIPYTSAVGNQETLKVLLEQEVKPTWVTCRYFERSVYNIPRFPVVIDWGNGVRED